MGFRQTLDKHKAWLVPLFLVVVGAVLFYTFWMPGTDDLAGPVDKAFYTTDGKTYFADSLSKRCPFDHQGKPAYRAFVFRNKPSEAPFIAYLGRHVMNQANVGPPGSAPPKVDSTVPENTTRAPDEVAKPDMKTWVPANSPEGMAIVNSIVASGNRPEPVMPD